MKLLLIRLGKATKAIQRDGLVRGGKRVIKAFFAMFRWVGSGDILFVTNGVGDSALYRNSNVAEELELHGLKCSVTMQDNPFLTSYANKFKIFIFHRTLYVGGVINLIAEIKKQNKEIIFETDDLVYDPKYLEYMDYFKNINVLEKKLYKNGVGGEILNDEYVKVCTTTTTFLADKLKGANKKVFIVPNKLNNSEVEIASNILQMKEKSQDCDLQIVKIGYFSGTMSHNKDFATVVDALTEVMEKYPQTRLILAGPLEVENNLNKFINRIDQLPFVPRAEHFSNVANVDINISPLEIGNPFCESKSELKFFEAGIVGVPTIASATQTFCEAIEDGVDGFVASGTSEWVEKLEKLIVDRNLRIKIGKQARAKVLEKYTNKNSHNDEYYNYLKAKL